MLKIRGDSKEGTNDLESYELFFGENEFRGDKSKIDKTFHFCKHLKKNRGSARKSSGQLFWSCPPDKDALKDVIRNE
jgi:hypothetical protein